MKGVTPFITLGFSAGIHNLKGQYIDGKTEEMLRPPDILLRSRSSLLEDLPSLRELAGRGMVVK